MSKFGLSAQNITQIITILARYKQVDKAIIYGSRAMGNYKTGSDIDLTLLGDTINFNILHKIASELDDSDIPFVVDLSIYGKIENHELRQHIDRVGVVFYKKSN